MAVRRQCVAHSALDVMENQNARSDRAAGRFDCAETLWIAGRNQQRNADRAPEASHRHHGSPPASTSGTTAARAIC